MKILLYEHVSSGGLLGNSIPANLLCEGYGMLRGIASDFKSAGHEVSILLDSRIASLSPHFQANEIKTVSSKDQIPQMIDKLCKNVDAAFVIAPEHDNVLQSLVERIEATSAVSLNCGSKAIEQISNKVALLERASKLELDFPKTLTFNVDEPIAKITQSIKSKLGFPVVIKPSRGTGCSGLSLAVTEIQLAEAIKKVKNELPYSDVIAQEYIQGINASVSAICTTAEALPVSLNFQEVKLCDPSSDSNYTGGQVPLENPLKTKAFDATKRLLTSFKHLAGYVGVDFVLTKEKAFVIEANPRLTTSYVGLRKVVNQNLSQVILDSVLKQEIPRKMETHGVALFRKVSH